jgi:hypothetical protein
MNVLVYDFIGHIDKECKSDMNLFEKNTFTCVECKYIWGLD